MAEANTPVPLDDVNDDQVQPAKHPATKAQKIQVALFLVVTVVIGIIAMLRITPIVEAKLERQFRASWETVKGVNVDEGPRFGYESEAKELIHRGPINDARKQELLGRVRLNGKRVVSDSDVSEATDADDKTKPPAADKDPGAAGGDPTESGDPPAETAAESGKNKPTPEQAEALAAYPVAIGHLTFLSNNETGVGIHWLFLLGGCAGLIGAQARSTWLFIRIACFHNQLDVVTWWPWYWMRPVLGFILGGFFIVLVHAGLMSADQGAANSGAFGWLALSFLVGFAIKEFVHRLTQVTKAMFGAGAR